MKKRHVMRFAKLSPVTARRLGLSSNHHGRVWCECMSGQASVPGALPSGLYWSGRPSETVAADPRRLGGWDSLGVVDMRDWGSALRLFRAHLSAEEGTHG